MKARTKRSLLAVLAASVFLACATGAYADDDDGLGVTLGLALPGLSAEVSNQGAYYAAPGYYAPPPPVVYAPPPPPPPPAVVYEPAAPVYYAPGPRRGPPPWAGVWRH